MSAGSIWQKWDLHLHIPGTKMANGYNNNHAMPPIDEFCQVLEESDVQVFGLTDYFSLDTVFDVIDRYGEIYPDSKKLLIPNLELRLDRDVSARGQNVNLHILFNPGLPRTKIKAFIDGLETTKTTGVGGPHKTCAELAGGEFESATVTVESIMRRIRTVFGGESHASDRRRSNLILIASTKNDGIRPNTRASGAQRRALLSDEMDKLCDGFFGNKGNVDWFLSADRYGDSSQQRSSPKPVFDGCDAHDFEQLRSRLGRESVEAGDENNILWIKADLTYNGLLQTFLEPSTRVHLGAIAPDLKVGYKVIRKIEFEGTDDFPTVIEFNPNLNSIIGSRSSGKSSLLAHIAYAVNPEETLEAQSQASPHLSREDLGPAAGIKWDDTNHMKTKIVWDSTEATEGRVIYVPQNSLYALSEKSEEITSRIEPALDLASPAMSRDFLSLRDLRLTTSTEVRGLVSEWFITSAEFRGLRAQLDSLGGRAAIEDEMKALNEQIAQLSRTYSITDDELAKISHARNEIARLERSLEVTIRELDDLTGDFGTQIVESTPVEVNISVLPDFSHRSPALASSMAGLVEFHRGEMAQHIGVMVSTRIDFLTVKRSEFKSAIDEVKEGSRALLEKEERVGEISRLRDKNFEQEKQLSRINHLNERISLKRRELFRTASSIKRKIARYRDKASSFVSDIVDTNIEIESMTIGAEVGVSDLAVRKAMNGMNASSTNVFVPTRGAVIDYQRAMCDPVRFLDEVDGARVRLVSGVTKESFATEVLTLLPEIRLKATLEGDAIGGFRASSMTPGKQALFALSLTLGADSDGWPLLLDQPEDDLDSRSIFGTIAEYLTKQKQVRQIIMVTHNANLAIGADSEQIIVANRHGSDHPNEDGRLFSYLGGAIEHERDANPGAEYALDRLDVPSHACEILDGGAEAFMKRSQRYLL